MKKNKLTRAITRLVAEQVRGVISVYNFDNYFYVKIIDTNNFVWLTEIEEIQIKCTDLLKAKFISTAIIESYRKYIINKYFY